MLIKKYILFCTALQYIKYIIDFYSLSVGLSEDQQLKVAILQKNCIVSLNICETNLHYAVTPIPTFLYLLVLFFIFHPERTTSQLQCT